MPGAHSSARAANGQSANAAHDRVKTKAKVFRKRLCKNSPSGWWLFLGSHHRKPRLENGELFASEFRTHNRLFHVQKEVGILRLGAKIFQKRFQFGENYEHLSAKGEFQKKL